MSADWAFDEHDRFPAPDYEEDIPSQRSMTVDKDRGADYSIKLLVVKESTLFFVTLHPFETMIL